MVPSEGHAGDGLVEHLQVGGGSGGGWGSETTGRLDSSSQFAMRSKQIPQQIDRKTFTSTSY